MGQPITMVLEASTNYLKKNSFKKVVSWTNDYGSSIAHNVSKSVKCFNLKVLHNQVLSTDKFNSALVQ